MEEIQVERTDDGAVRTITINRPAKRNAISFDMFEELTSLFKEEPPVTERVTVLKSAGTVFTSGIDLNERLVRGAPPLDAACEAIWHYPLPVVARVQGDAIAGGAFIAVACDFVVANEDARIWFSLVQIGLAPPWILSRHLAGRTGFSLARDLVLLGDAVPARRLADANVITSAVPLDALDDEVNRVVDRLARNAPLSLRAIKATLAAEPYQQLPHDHIEALIHSARDSEDGREGVTARLERRMPQYTGR